MYLLVGAVVVSTTLLVECILHASLMIAYYVLYIYAPGGENPKEGENETHNFKGCVFGLSMMTRI